MTVISAALLLLLVMDPFGNITFFMTTLKHVDPRRQRMIIIRELLIALAILVLFLFTGPTILSVLNISERALSIAGAIILFLISLRMIFPGTGVGFDDELQGEPFVVPLAIPFVAGPSAMASVLFIMSQEPARWPEWLFAVIVAWFITGSILYLSTSIHKFLGRRGLIAIERLMGMILTTIAVQMLLSGIADFMSNGG